MWETLGKVFTGSWAPLYVGLVVLIIVVLIILIKKGWLKINIKGVGIGASDNERRIIRQQIKYVESCVQIVYSELPIFKECMDKYHALYVLEKVFDIFVETIALNHVTTDEPYIYTKQVEVWGKIQSFVENEQFRTEEFHDTVNKYVDTMIRQLVKIREYYS